MILYFVKLWSGYVGEVRTNKKNEEKYYLFTHKDITIKYNGDQVCGLLCWHICHTLLIIHYFPIYFIFFNFQIIHVNLTQGGAKPLEVGKALDMTYSVKWIETDIPFAKRFDVYLDYPFFEHQVAVLFIVNYINNPTDLCNFILISHPSLLDANISRRRSTGSRSSIRL